MPILPPLIPLIQSLLWIMLISSLIYYFRKDIQLLRGAIQQRIEAGEPVKLGPLEFLERKVAIVAEEVEVTKGEVNQKIELQEKSNDRKLLGIVNGMMSTDTYSKLKIFNSGNYGSFDNTSSLRRELRYLRQIGYITVRGRIHDLPSRGDDLSEYVTVTDAGRNFVDFREEYEAEKD